jgi:hypothetical protein
LSYHSLGGHTREGVFPVLVTFSAALCWFVSALNFIASFIASCLGNYIRSSHFLSVLYTSEWAIIAENTEINLVLRYIPFSRDKQRKILCWTFLSDVRTSPIFRFFSIPTMIASIQNWNLVSRGYRDTANLEPCKT